MPAARVTVTLPEEIVEKIDRIQKNRSGFVLEAVRHELSRRRREELRRSLREPHPETLELADAGFDEWAKASAGGGDAALVDARSGTAVCWTPERGWVEVEK
jgi:Arc/MetJ-type ribon-helix-helix transcriptional regulator